MMMYKKAVCVIVLTCVVVTSRTWGAGGDFSQSPTASAAERPSTTPDTSTFDRLRADGFTALYNTDYKSARELFLKMTKLAPDHPAGYLYLANNMWVETLYASRRLTTSVYTGSSFYADPIVDDKVDPKRDAEFADLIRQSVAASKAMLAKNPGNAEAIYYYASALGVRAAYATSVKRSFKRAIGDAKDSVQLHHQVLKIDPNYIDSYLSIGLFDYIVGNLPFGWRMLARITGMKGSKTRGVELLERVTKEGKYTADDARVVLIAIYGNEGKPDKALETIAYLSEKYPRNNLFKIERGSMLYNMGRKEEGAKIFAGLLEDETVKASAVDLVNYEWAEALMKSGDHSGAIEKLRAVIQSPKSNASLVSLSHLYAGEALDAVGKRDEALKEYQVVLQRENIFDSHKLAERYSKKPYVVAKS
jgi:tetratricopeptide (TPR) repeat protein